MLLRKRRTTGLAPRRRSMQVAANVRAQIINGDLSPDSPVLPNDEFRHRFEATKGTAAPALDKLKAETWLVGHRGKKWERMVRRRRGQKQGVYVPAGPPQVREAALYIEPVGGYSHTLLTVDEVTPPADVRNALGLEADGVAVLRKRRTLLRGQPAELSWSYYPIELARGTELAEKRKIRGGALRALRSLGYKPKDCVDQLLARMATDGELRDLGLPHETALLRTFRVITDGGGQPLEVSVLVKPATACVMQYRVFVAPTHVEQGDLMSDRYDEHEEPDPAVDAPFGAQEPSIGPEWARDQQPTEPPLSAEEQPALKSEQPQASRFQEQDPIDRNPLNDHGDEPVGPADRTLRDSTRRTVFGYGEEGFGTWDDVEHQRRTVCALNMAFVPTPDVAATLFDPEVPQVLEWKRCYLLDGQPKAVATSYVPRGLAEGAGVDVDRAMYHNEGRLARVRRGAVGHQEELHAREATPEEIDDLRLAPGQWVHEIIRVVFDQAGKAVEVNRIVADAAAYRFRYHIRA